MLSGTKLKKMALLDIHVLAKIVAGHEVIQLKNETMCVCKDATTGLVCIICFGAGVTHPKLSLVPMAWPLPIFVSSCWVFQKALCYVYFYKP